jgi:hypothetical protein
MVTINPLNQEGRMVLLNFTQEELDMLQSILKSYLSDLRMEIADTDKKDFRDELKKQEKFLTELLNLLAQKSD